MSFAATVKRGATPGATVSITVKPAASLKLRTAPKGAVSLRVHPVALITHLAIVAKITVAELFKSAIFRAAGRSAVFRVGTVAVASSAFVFAVGVNCTAHFGVPNAGTITPTNVSVSGSSAAFARSDVVAHGGATGTTSGVPFSAVLSNPSESGAARVLTTSVSAAFAHGISVGSNRDIVDASIPVELPAMTVSRGTVVLHASSTVTAADSKADFSLNSVTSRGSAAPAVGGFGIVFSTGNVFVTGDTIIPAAATPSGVAMTSAEGTCILSGNAQATPSGRAFSSNVGTSVLHASVNLAVTGVAATFSRGTAAGQGSNGLAPTGVSSVFTEGTSVAHGNATVSPSGRAMTSARTSPTESGTASVSPSGQAMTSALGTATAASVGFTGVSNGSFASGLTGWTNSGNVTTSTPSSPSTATDETHIALFNSGGTTANGVIQQTINTTNGQAYLLTFDAGAAGTVSTTVAVKCEVTGATALVNQSNTLTGGGAGSGSGTHVWSRFAYSFVADSTSVVLKFTDISAATTNIDLTLDNVVLTEISSASLLVSENFDSGSTPSGWTSNFGGTINFNTSTNPSPQGGNHLAVSGTADSSSGGGRYTFGSTVNDLWTYRQFRIGTTNGAKYCFLSDVCKIYSGSNSMAWMVLGGTTVPILFNTWYHVWTHSTLTQQDIYVSTTGLRPLTASASTSGSYAGTTYICLSFQPSQGAKMDKVRAAAFEIGSNPV